MNKSVTYSAPARIDLSGGATDWCGMHTISLAINLRAYATLSKLEDENLISIKIGNLEENYYTPIYSGNLDLFKAVIELSGLKGFRVEYRTDIPKGSGLGGSAPLTVSTLFGLNELFKKNWNKYYIAELAQRAETFKLKTVNGFQDQYSATFGGFIFMDFEGKACQKGKYTGPVESEPYAVVERLDDYLPNFNIVVAVPTITRTGSDETNSKVSELYLAGDERIVRLMHEKASLTRELKRNIVEKNSEQIFEIINNNNNIMREFGFLAPENEEMISIANKIGVLASKTTGAGRGAVAFFVESEVKQNQLIEEFEKHKFIRNIFKIKPDVGAQKEK